MRDIEHHGMVWRANRSRDDGRVYYSSELGHIQRGFRGRLWWWWPHNTAMPPLRGPYRTLELTMAAAEELSRSERR